MIVLSPVAFEHQVAAALLHVMSGGAIRFSIPAVHRPGQPGWRWEP